MNSIENVMRVALEKQLFEQYNAKMRSTFAQELLSNAENVSGVKFESHQGVLKEIVAITDHGEEIRLSLSTS